MATITVMTIRTPMATDLPALVQLLWLASPALPVGGFSYSEGLEAAIDHGWVQDEASCTDWLVDQLLVCQARGDGALIAQALPAWRGMDWPRLQVLGQWIEATRDSAEMRLQSEQMGRSLQLWLQQWPAVPAQALQWLASLPPSYALAQALALSAATGDDGQALQSWAFAWCENMTQAAIKAVPLGQSSGQRILHALAQQIDAAVALARACTDEERQVFSPMLGILSARHETQYSRLFRS